MATLTVQFVTSTGLVPSFSSAGSTGDRFKSTANDAFLYIKNGSTNTCTVTATRQRISITVSGYGKIALPNLTVDVTSGQNLMIGPFEKSFTRTVSRDVTNYVNLTYSTVASVTVAAVRLPLTST
jgi:hypothetical protein